MQKNDQILLARRYQTGFHDGDYGLPAGHLDGNETIVQAMIREAREEIGIQLNQEYLELVHVMYRKKPDEERIDFFFIASNWKGEPVIMEVDKCDDLSWFPFSKLPVNIIPYINQAIDCMHRKVMYSEYGWH